MENNILSKTISYLRFPLMTGIVMMHFNLLEELISHGITYEGGENPAWYHTIVYLLSTVLPTIGVPLFFFFSGFLFFYHTQWNVATYKRKLKTRARTLLLPYFLWNLFAIAWAGFKLLPCFAKVNPNIGKIGLDWSFSTIAYMFWDHSKGLFVNSIEDLTGDAAHFTVPIDGPLWYVRDLMIVVVCAPLVYWLAKKAGYFLPVVLGLAWYFAAPYRLGYPLQLLTAFFFFSWGACYSIRQLDFTVLFRKLPYFPILYIAVAAADIMTKGQYYNIYIHNVGIFAGIVSAIIITASLLEKGRVRVNPFLAGASFFLYAAHALIINSVSTIIFGRMHISSPYFLIMIYFVVPALTIAICLGVYGLLRKYLPACAALLTGGR